MIARAHLAFGQGKLKTISYVLMKYRNYASEEWINNGIKQVFTHIYVSPVPCKSFVRKFATCTLHHQCVDQI